MWHAASDPAASAWRLASPPPPWGRSEFPLARLRERVEVRMCAQAHVRERDTSMWPSLSRRPDCDAHAMRGARRAGLAGYAGCMRRFIAFIVLGLLLAACQTSKT